MTYVYAATFLLLAPWVAASARFTLLMYWDDTSSGVAFALAAAMVIAATVAIFLALISALYIFGAIELVMVLANGVLPSLIILEVLTLVVPTYLKRRA